MICQEKEQSNLNDFVKNVLKVAQETEVFVVVPRSARTCQTLRSFNKTIDQWLDSILLIIRLKNAH